MQSKSDQLHHNVKNLGLDLSIITQKAISQKTDFLQGKSQSMKVNHQNQRIDSQVN
jgi:hypothetical protein